MKHQLNEKDYKLLKRWMAKRGITDYGVVYKDGKARYTYHNEGYWMKFFESEQKEVKE